MSDSIRKIVEDESSRAARKRIELLAKAIPLANSFIKPDTSMLGIQIAIESAIHTQHELNRIFLNDSGPEHQLKT